MATATLNIYVRTRRMWIARLAAYIGSKRLFAWAIRQARVDVRHSEQKPWEPTSIRIRYDPETNRIEAPWMR